MVKGIGHVNFVISDVEKSLHFYCEILGFVKLFDLEVEAKNGTGKIVNTYLRICDGQYLELRSGQVTYPEAADDPKLLIVGYNHICFEVEDINQIADQLRKHGIRLHVEPRQARDMNYICWAQDPDGNRIEFMQMHPESPQLTTK